MNIVRTVAEVRRAREHFGEASIVGLVPTMGALQGAGLALATLPANSALSLVVVSLRGGLPKEESLTVEIAGLYWHFVDIVWIVIFTLVYLIPAPLPPHAG